MAMQKLGLCSIALTLAVVLEAQPTFAGDQWAAKRDATPQEQHMVDEYRNGGSPWSLQMDFHDKDAAQRLFEVVTDDKSEIKSCRKPENIVIDKVLRLQTKVARNCRSRWSTGYVVTKNWQQRYGFFEARMRITEKTGINNAFWLTGKNLEIDIVEAHVQNDPRWPDIHWTVHDWGSHPARAVGCGYAAGGLSDKANDYGLLWLPDRLVYTFNGNAVCTIDTKFASAPAEIRFSTAVADFAGKTPDDPTGTEMDVYALRVAPLKK